MKKFLLITLVLIGAVGGYFGFQKIRSRPTTPLSTTLISPSTTVATSPTPFDKDKWNEVYKDPFVLHVRKALNGYLNGTNEGISLPELVIPSSEGDTGGRSGLSTFRDYFKSKFIVLSIADNKYGGGKGINIMFQDKPDKVFWVWVYHTAGTYYYDLRGLAENTNFSQEFIQNFQKNNSEMLKDKEHAL